MDQENYIPTRKPAHESVESSSLPPALARAKMKQAESKPKEVSTGNSKLDQLLMGIKETVYKYEEILLPSKGKFYDDEIAPSNGIIHVRMMTGEEDEILTKQRLLKNGQALNMIYASCIKENVKPEEMLAVDRTYLLIFLRGISHGERYNTSIRCPDCNKSFETEIDLDSLELERCPDDFDKESLKGKLPKSGYKFSYRLATGKDEQMVNDYQERKTKKNNDDDVWSYRASLLINDIEGLEDKSALQTLLSKLPVADVSHIRSLLNNPPFGVNTEIPMQCAYCDYEFEALLPLDVNFFFPTTTKKTENTHATS